MRTVAAAALLALTSLMVAPAVPAAAVAGYDSLYQFESAFLTMNPGDTNTFSVFFANTGTTVWAAGTATQTVVPVLDRKSTRLNSSHGYISYAVFCLEKQSQDDV